MGESKTMKRIRVLHSELNGELGGIESFLYNVYRFIDKEKVEFDFLTISDTPAYGDKFKKMGSTVYKVPKHINFLGYYFAIDKILREGNYDIVHIHKNSAIDILILKVLQRFPNIKVVVHSHNTFPSVGGKLEKLHKFNRKYLYDNADYRLACSDNAGKWMYGNGAFEIIKNGIDTKGFRFCTEYGEEIRAMYGIPMNAFVIGHVGRFTNQKNHSKLIDIFAAIKERKSDAYLLLLGGGELQDTIKSKVEKLNLCDSVIFCGVRTDVNKYLCAMDAFVFPSTWEGLGIVAIEAQASGLECYLSRELPKEVEVTDIDWIYQGLEEYGYITGRSVVIKCISLALLVVFVKTREDYVAYALLTSLALGGNYIFNVIHARKMVGFTLVNLKIRKHIKPIVFIAGIIFMSTIYNKIDITMLSALSTDEAVGYYSYAQRTVNIVLTMCSAVTAIFLPRLSYYYDNEKAVFYKLMDKGFQILCLGVVPLAVGLFLTANQAVVLLYGDSFTPTGTTIKLMCPLILIKGFGDLLCYQLAYSSKNEYILLPGSAIASIINVITNSILIPLYAQNGAVIASVMSELTTNIIQFLYLKRKIKYHISNTALVLSLFSTMVMAAVVCAIIKMNLPLAVALAMEISIGGAIYLLMNIALKNRILSEMLTKVLKKHNTGFQDS